MKGINLGIVSLMVSSKLRDSYFNQTQINESKEDVHNLFECVKKSPLLQLEFSVFNNLENKHIDNDIIATRYIDKNISLFETYTIEEILEEREKIKNFYNENTVIDEYRKNLYEAINTLILESLNVNENINVDSVHDSFTFVLNHIKKPINERNTTIITESIDDTVSDDIIKIAIKRYNEKYSTLNESDRNLLVKLIKSNDEEKKKLFENYKSGCLVILDAMDDASIKDKRQKVVDKINDMSYSPETVNENIIKLHELKTELI